MTFALDFIQALELIEIYQSLELVKDGVFTSPKYKTSSVKLGRYPEVVVMSNEYPDVSKLTRDRWDIKIIDRYGAHVAFNIMGKTAKKLYEKRVYLEQLKVEEALKVEKKYHSRIQEGVVFDIEHYHGIFRELEELEKLFNKKKVGVLTCKFIPVSEKDRDTLYGGRYPTVEEISCGKMSIVSIEDVRDMTEQEKETFERNKKNSEDVRERLLEEWSNNVIKPNLESIKRLDFLKDKNG